MRLGQCKDDVALKQALCTDLRTSSDEVAMAKHPESPSRFRQKSSWSKSWLGEEVSCCIQAGPRLRPFMLMLPEQMCTAPAHGENAPVPSTSQGGILRQREPGS